MRRLFLHASLFATALLAASCADSREAARAGLARRHIEYTTEEFVQRAAQGDIGAVHLFLISGMNADEPSPDGRLALVEAVAAGQTDMVRALLVKGADPNATDGNGMSPLLAAAANGSAHLAKLLINAGAVIDAPEGAGGATALMAAAENGHTQTVEFLLDKGADVSARNREGASAIELAERHGHAEIVRLLEKAGAKRSSENSESKRMNSGKPAQWANGLTRRGLSGHARKTFIEILGVRALRGGIPASGLRRGAVRDQA